MYELQTPGCRAGAAIAALLLSATVIAADAPARLINVRDMYPSVSPDGTTLVFESNRSGTSQIYRTEVTEDGRPANTVRLTDVEFGAETPVISPDGRSIALAIYVDEGNNDVFVMDLDGGNLRRVTDGPGYDGHPHWSADGQRIVFNSDRTTPDQSAEWGERWHEIFSVALDGGDLRQHTQCRTVCTYGSLSPDGESVLYRKVLNSAGLNWALNPSERNSEVFVADVDGGNERNLSNHGAFDGWPVWSPDGSRIAFASNRRGPPRTGHIWSVAPDGSGLRQETQGIWSYAQPAWSFDGSSIFAYQSKETEDYEFGSIVEITLFPR